jgi:hypothetical protein
MAQSRVRNSTPQPEQARSSRSIEPGAQTVPPSTQVPTSAHGPHPQALVQVRVWLSVPVPHAPHDVVRFSD